MISHRSYRPRSRPNGVQSRHGLTTPIVALALLVAMGGLALIVDRLWLETSHLELTAATEAAALAAARELANDDLLRPPFDQARHQQVAREAAAFAARNNLVAGDPVELNPDPARDVRLGRLILDPYQTEPRFEETDVFPTTVVVTATRSRGGNNPVGLFVAGVTGLPFGDVSARVEATVDNRIVGVRPHAGGFVPAIPIAILWKDPTGKREDTWQHQIESKRGRDDYAYDANSGEVKKGSDGIPEMMLRTRGRNEAAQQWGSSTASTQTKESNLLLLDVGTGLSDNSLTRQFESGWSSEDLEEFDGELRVSPEHPQKLRSLAELNHADREAIEQLIGEPRICLLYSEARTNSQSHVIDATCVKLVAIRIIDVRDQKNGACEILVQPCVLATRTALLEPSTPYHTGHASETNPQSTNPYIYKLHLTR